MFVAWSFAVLVSIRHLSWQTQGRSGGDTPPLHGPAFLVTGLHRCIKPDCIMQLVPRMHSRGLGPTGDDLTFLQAAQGSVTQ